MGRIDESKIHGFTLHINKNSSPEIKIVSPLPIHGGILKLPTPQEGKQSNYLNIKGGRIMFERFSLTKYMIEVQRQSSLYSSIFNLAGSHKVGAHIEINGGGYTPNIVYTEVFRNLPA